MTRLKTWLVVIGVLAVLAGAALVVRQRMMGDSGPTSELGGSIEAPLIPDFPTGDAARWVNGEPASLEKMRGSVVLIEAWHPS